MAEAPNCLRCRAPMEEGFLADAGYGVIQQVRWCRGAPQPSFWGGEVKGRQMVEGSRVTTMRCPKCGYLESYALDTPSSNL
jgi:hypothetical protein